MVVANGSVTSKLVVRNVDETSLGKRIVLVANFELDMVKVGRFAQAA